MNRTCIAIVGAACAAIWGMTGSRSLASPPVAPTEWLSPEQEKAKFKLPPGFEAQLVASEPDIHKPMNICFDARGRLWLTDTVEYPFPVKPGEKGRDTVKVLEDFDENGRARKITTFVDGLNIPLGVLPVENGKSVDLIAYSIPEVRKYIDTDGDGRADKSEPMLSGYASADTHGMTNNFIQGFDGYIYANHGFKNDSDVKAADGSSAKMQSGHTYRFRQDGTKLEIFVHGQVNPFGLCFDPLGNLFSADCHSRPQYMLLRGAYYPSFGKPDDGLGFGPEMCNHDHGSTAISGTLYYAAEQFPPEFRGNLFDGNVVTNAIDRDTVEWHGSSPKAIQAKNFLESDDPWFRPVQIKLGPDGAMWVADFYNKIIGHYEVDLKHPGRDRTSGRIWRIVYKGNAAKAPAPNLTDLSKVRPAELIEKLADRNLTVRLIATNYLAAHCDVPARAALEAAVLKPTGWEQRVHAIWVLERNGALSPQLLNLAAKDSDAGSRVHVMRVLAEREKWSEADDAIALAGLEDVDPTVRRCAADALGRRPAAAHVAPLLAARGKAAADDLQLAHVLKMALRDTLAAPGTVRKLPLDAFSASERQAIAEVIPAIAGEEAGAFVVAYLKGNDVDPATAAKFLRHAARFVPEKDLEDLATVVSKRFADDPAFQLELLRGVRDSLTQRGMQPGPNVTQWARTIAGHVLTPKVAEPAAQAWTNHAVEGTPPSADPWGYESRKCADGKSAELFSSFPRGETLTGVLRSKSFDLPPQLSFYLCGHNGLPTTKSEVKNMIRLKEVGTDKILIRTSPPRNDVAQQVTWDLKPFAGKKGYIEVVDADTRTAYAWIAFGRLEPAIVPMPTGGITDGSKRQEAAAEIAGWLKLKELSPALGKLATAAETAPAARTAAAKALVQIDAKSAVVTLAAPLDDANAASAVREAAAAALSPLDSAEARAALVNALKTAPQKLQQSIAVGLAGTKPGGEALLDAVGQGKASARLLLDKPVRDRLNQSKPDNFVDRVNQLTKGMPTAEEAIQKLIDERIAAFRSASAKANQNRGREVFTKNCAACHKIENNGATVGPQLDGVGKRGGERLVEDILDPSRNVDAAFRYSVITTDTGDVLTGLLRREEGQTIVFADGQGKEFAIPKKQITKQVQSQLSLMPGNFGQTVTAEEFNDLLAFLLAR